MSSTVIRRCFATTAYCNFAKKLPTNLKNRSKSSQEWLSRHINDSYVKRAKMENYRARSAFKLLEIDNKYQIFKAGQLVVDCGAAPGSWTQVATGRVNARNLNPDLPIGKVIAVDLAYISPIEGAVTVSKADFTSPKTHELIKGHMGEQRADVVMSDMAPNVTGISSLDHEVFLELASAALLFALRNLNIGGTFLCKLFDSPQLAALEEHAMRFFPNIKRIKPESSRMESPEIFLLARQFKGTATS